MAREDTVDFITAFAVGTVLGVGAALLLQPNRTPRERVMRQLKPYRKQMKRSYSQVREGLRSGRGATSGMTKELVGSGREILDDFRSEIAEILEDARAEMRDMVRGPRKGRSDAVRRARRKMGM